MAFTATATPPDSDSGAYLWIQLIGQNSWTFRQNPQTQAHTLGTGLDNGYYPYPVFQAGSGNTNDSPGIELTTGFNAAQPSATEYEATENFSATMYLLWDPALPSGCTPASNVPGHNGQIISTTSNCTSIPVPLGSIPWSFGSNAIDSLDLTQGVSGWINQSCGAGFPGAFLAGQGLSGYPNWTTSTQNIPPQ